MFVFSLLFFTIALFSYYRHKSVYHPVFVFALLWFIILFFDCLNLYGLYRSHIITYLVIFLGVLFFCIGVSFSCLSNGFAKNSRQFKYSTSVRYTPFFVLLGLTILLLLYPAIKNLLGVLNGEISFFDIRDSFGNPYSNKLLQLIYNYVATPFSNACLPIVAVIIISEKGKKTRKASFFGIIALLLLRILTDAGRGIIVYFLVMLAFSYFINKNKKGVKNSNFKRIKKYLIFFVVASTILYLFVTILRGAKGTSSILKQIYVYICGCVPFLDYHLTQISESGVQLFGFGGLHGPLEFLFTMLENVGIVSYPDLMTSSDLWYNNALETIQIGDTSVYNAYATLFYNVFLDGGFFSLIVEMLLYGLICGVLFLRVKNNKYDLRIKATYLYILYGLVFSFVRFQFSLSSHFLAFIMIALLFKKKGCFAYESTANQCCLSNG